MRFRFKIILVTLFLSLYVQIHAQASIIASGTCGVNDSNLKWEVDSEYTLLIYGSGSMKNYDTESAPWHNYAIQRAVIQSGVTSVGNGSFAYSSLTEIELPSTINSIGKRAFSNSKIQSIRIPDLVYSIPSDCFEYCYDLKSVHLPKNLRVINQDAFIACNSLEAINLDHVLTIDKYAFTSCKSLKKIILAAGVSIAKSCAFSFTTSLQEVYFLGSASTFGFSDVCPFYSSNSSCTFFYPAELGTWTYDKQYNISGGWKDSETGMCTRWVPMSTPPSIISIHDQDNNTLNCLNYAYGNFFYDTSSNTASNQLKLKINTTTPGKYKCKIILPDGFSFSSAELQNILEVETNYSTLDSNGYYTYETNVFALYSNNTPNSVTFKIEGDLETEETIQIKPLAKEGIVHARPTDGVNRTGLKRISTKININPISDFMEQSSDIYSSKLSWMGCLLSQAAYSEEFVIDSLKNLGFIRIHPFNYASTTGYSVASCIGSKPIIIDNQIYTYLAVVIRGTYASEWIGDFIIEDLHQNKDDAYVHSNFQSAADDVKNFIKLYCNTYSIKPQRTRMYICGHSRAGAVANLLAHDFNLNSVDQSIAFNPNNITAYTFAAPNCTKAPLADPNIHNYAYIHDLIAYIPAGDGFGKHGNTYIVGNDSAVPKSVSDQYQVFCGRDYMNPNNSMLIRTALSVDDSLNAWMSRPQVSKWLGGMLNQPIGNNPLAHVVAQAHGAENYMAWVSGNNIENSITFNSALREFNSLMNTTIQNTYSVLKASAFIIKHCEIVTTASEFFHSIHNTLNFSIFGISCPVNIKLENEQGDTVAIFKDHKLQSFDSNFPVFVFSEEESDYLALPRNSYWKLTIIGNDTGNMDIAIASFNQSMTNDGMQSFMKTPVSKHKRFYLTCSQGITAQEIKLIQESIMSLPQSLIEIDSMAFSGINADSVIIPPSVSIIAEDAFVDSNIRTIYGSTDYVKDYALNHNFEYIDSEELLY